MCSDTEGFSLEPAAFAKLGALAEAGRLATRLALERAAEAGRAGRVPIAGAVVSRSLEVIAVGSNARIPAPDSCYACQGYPTDHGETAAIRRIDDVEAVDWAGTVFATSLSPCIMCTRTLAALHTKGLRHLVIAESKSFQGPEHILEALPEFTILKLEQPRIVEVMRTFARQYPWDWAADIGEIPARASSREELLARARREGAAWLAQRSSGEAAVLSPRGDVLAVAGDKRGARGGNPCAAAVISAMGRAGSAVNLRECAVVWKPAGLPAAADFGAASLGACELFRPAALVAPGLDDELAAGLAAAGVELVIFENLPCGNDIRISAKRQRHTDM